MTGFHFGVFLIELGQVFIALGLITFVVAFLAYLWLLYEEKK
jgi:hypothetical protein